MTSVVLADDQELVRSGFRLILELAGLEVLGEAGDGRAAVELARASTPDVVLMDIRMPLMDGIEATRRIAQAGLPSRVLVLTTFDLDEYVYEALRAGASGFLLKDAGRERLVDAVRTVAAGEALFAPTVLQRLVAHYVHRPPQGVARLDGPLADLSEREAEVLRLVGRGLSNAEIADELVISTATVKTHVRHVLQKLGLRDRVQAVALAYEAGLRVDAGLALGGGQHRVEQAGEPVVKVVAPQGDKAMRPFWARERDPCLAQHAEVVRARRGRDAEVERSALRLACRGKRAHDHDAHRIAQCVHDGGERQLVSAWVGEASSHISISIVPSVLPFAAVFRGSSKYLPSLVPAFGWGAMFPIADSAIKHVDPFHLRRSAT